MKRKTNAERLVERADFITILAFVDRFSTREILLTFKGDSAADTSSQQERWVRRVLPAVKDLVATYESWTDPDPPYESHVLLRFDDEV